MTAWTDTDEQVVALRMVVAALIATWTEDELNARAKLWRTWHLGRRGEQMAEALEYLADARRAAVAAAS